MTLFAVFTWKLQEKRKILQHKLKNRPKHSSLLTKVYIQIFSITQKTTWLYKKGYIFSNTQKSRYKNRAKLSPLLSVVDIKTGANILHYSEKNIKRLNVKKSRIIREIIYFFLQKFNFLQLY